MSVLIDVVVGLVMVYFLAAILSSSVMEVVARKFAVRGKMMHEGLAQLVPDRWVYLRLINHPMVSGLFRLRPGEGNPPSYLPARNFAIALIDTIFSHEERNRIDNASTEEKKAIEIEHSLEKKDLVRLRSAIAKAKRDDLNIGHALEFVIDAAPDFETAAKEIEKWYDSGMQRVSGWYKAYAQKRLFIIGLVTAVIFNIDTLQIAGVLAQSSAIRASLTANAASIVGENQNAKLAEAVVDPYAELKKLYEAGLPIGYSCISQLKDLDRPNEPNASQGYSKLGACWNEAKNAWNENLLLKTLGWLLTAVAVSFGAPFWFDAMKKLINMRNAGDKPDETLPAKES